MIPKIIHYCWFGKKEKPLIVKLCLHTWQKYCPDFVIKEWNESNFNVNLYPFTRQAYDCKKYAFVADVARLYALVNEGGIYLDTDVFFLKSFPETLLQKKALVGFEQDGLCLGTALMACEANHAVFKDFLQIYRDKSFLLDAGEINATPNVIYFTELLKSYGLCMNDGMQCVKDVDILPSAYFSPMIPKNNTRNLNIKGDTLCVHLFYSSWNKYSITRKMKILVNRVIQFMQLFRYF